MGNHYPAAIFEFLRQVHRPLLNDMVKMKAAISSKPGYLLNVANIKKIKLREQNYSYPLKL